MVDGTCCEKSQYSGMMCKADKVQSHFGCMMMELADGAGPVPIWLRPSVGSKGIQILDAFRISLLLPNWPLSVHIVVR